MIFAVRYQSLCERLNVYVYPLLTQAFLYLLDLL